MNSSRPMSVADILPPEEMWARELASAVRLILATGADEPQVSREKFIEEQVQRSLQTLAPGQRGRHLECLKAHFPTGPVDGAAPVESPSPAAPAAARPQTPEEVLRVVLEAWSRFSADQRVALQEQLGTAGVAGGGAADFTEVRQRLGLAAGEAVVAVRLGRLAVQEFEFLAKLDQLVWNTWKTVAPRSGLKRDNTYGDIRLQTRRYLKGDAEPTDLQVASQIERTRQLIASLLGSISQVSRGYVKKFQTRYAPEAVQDLVKIEGGAGGLFGGNVEAKCWRKYCELATEVNEATIQNEMQEVVVKYVEELMRGMAKSGA